MKKIILSLIALSATAVSSCKPATAQEEAEKLDVHRISATISNQNITDFQEDAQGYIWIGTTRGLNRFNAHEYRQYYSSNDITATARRQDSGHFHGLTQTLMDSDNRRNMPIY